MKLKKLILNLNPTDLLIVVYSLYLSLVNIIFFDKVEEWYLLVSFNAFLIFFVFTIAYLDKNKSHFLIMQLHYWYIVPLILIIFKQLYFMVKPIRNVDYDHVLIEIDRWMFGFDPTVELYKIANPYLTELLQIVYGLFFFLPIILAVDLMINKRIGNVKYEAFIILFGFLLSYIGYILVPAIGPRFTLHDFYLKEVELPGLFLTEFLREIVNSGESIPGGTIDAIDKVQRDVFPSGHTQMTLLTMYLAVKFKTKTKNFFLVVGTLLIFATVYLRYHYVIDLIAGFFFMVFTLWSGYHLYNWWMNKTGEEKFEYGKY
jgi:membrane-associated phospholipid phosphatase